MDHSAVPIQLFTNGQLSELRITNLKDAMKSSAKYSVQAASLNLPNYSQR